MSRHFGNMSNVKVNHNLSSRINHFNSNEAYNETNGLSTRPRSMSTAEKKVN